jgi:hypothetical protein
MSPFACTCHGGVDSYLPSIGCELQRRNHVDGVCGRNYRRGRNGGTSLG